MQGTQEEWRDVFFLSGGVLLFAGLVYILLAEGGVAEWAKGDENIDDKHDAVNRQTETAENKETEPVSVTESTDIRVWF